MGNYFTVIKTIRKRRYVYRQRVWKEGGKTRTHSIYLCPEEKLTAHKLALLSGHTPQLTGREQAIANKITDIFAPPATTIENGRDKLTETRAQFVEQTAQENHAFPGQTGEEKAYYDHLMSEAIHGATTETDGTTANSTDTGNTAGDSGGEGDPR